MLIPLCSTQIPNPAHRRCRRRRRRTSGTNRSPQPMKRRVLSHPIDPARPETDPIPSDSPQNSLSPAVSPQKNPQKTKLRGEKSGGSMEHRNRTESSEKTVRSPYSDLSDGLVHPILAGRPQRAQPRGRGPGEGRGAAARCRAWEVSSEREKRRRHSRIYRCAGKCHVSVIGLHHSVRRSLFESRGWINSGHPNDQACVLTLEDGGYQKRL